MKNDSLLFDLLQPSDAFAEKGILLKSSILMKTPIESASHSLDFTRFFSAKWHNFYLLNFAILEMT